MAKRISTTRRTADPMVTSFEANAKRWNEDAEQYNPATMAEPAKETSELDELRKSLAELRGQLATRQAEPVRVDTVVPKAPVPPAAVSYDGLPDPVADPEAYGRALGDRLQAKSRADAAYNNQVNQYQQGEVSAQDALYEDFTKKYADIAADEDGVQFVTTKVMKRLKARRIDPINYMFTNSDRFFDEVATEYKSTFNIEDEEETNPLPRARTAREEPEEANRTGGIHGGTESGGRPAQRAAAVSDLYTETRDIQRKGGWY